MATTTGDEALAEQASAAFAEGDCTKALELLGQLQKQREDDPKILHNEAVAQYVQSGSGDPRKLLAVLERLKQRADDAQADSDAGEGSVADVALGDVDPSLTAYNQAVLLYQLKQYSRCRAILEEMFSNIEPVDEFLVFRVCFLLLDVYMLQKQADKATEVLTYIERSFLALTKVEGSKENGSIDVPVEGSVVGIASDWPGKKSARRPPTDITPEEVRGALNTYKAKLALMARMSKSSKREIKTTLNACAQNTTGLFLKSNLEYLRQNYRKAIKLLNNSCQRSDRDPNVSALYFNNMGCIHHLMRRHTAACFYFTRALQENDALYSRPPEKAEQGIALPAFACDRRCEIQFNKGLQLLFSSRPEQAFASFQDALHLFHRQPRAWLRIGEACIATHIQQTQAAHAARQEELSLGLHAVQRLSLLQLSWCALTQGDHEQALSWARTLLSLDDVAATLKFYAHLYACNALCYLSKSAEALPHLLEAMQLGEAPQPESPPSPVEGEVAQLRNPYSPIPQSPHAAGQAAARAVLHTNLATVHILQGDLKQASQCAQKALELQPNSRNALLCLVYLEIRGGNLDAAREIMTKQVVPEPPTAASS